MHLPEAAAMRQLKAISLHPVDVLFLFVTNVYWSVIIKYFFHWTLFILLYLATLHADLWVDKKMSNLPVLFYSLRWPEPHIFFVWPYHLNYLFIWLWSNLIVNSLKKTLLKGLIIEYNFFFKMKLNNTLNIMRKF